MLRRTDWSTVTDVSEYHNAGKAQVKQSNGGFFSLHDNKDIGTIIFRNVGKCLPLDKA